jgi:hypothetical protein
MERWRLLKAELKSRILEPFKYPEFIFYFITIILLVGIASIIITVWIEFNLTQCTPGHEFSNLHVILCITLYFIALLTSSAVELILDPKPKTQGAVEKLKKSIIMIGVGSITVGLFIMFFSLINAESALTGYIIAGFGLFFSWFIWWIANSSNPKLTEHRGNPFQAIGQIADGNNNFELNGNLNGFDI